MALVSANFGEQLRDISNKANLSIAALSAYLNEVCLQNQVTIVLFTGSLSDTMLIVNIDVFQVLPAVLFVKANNAEHSECMRFERLAHTDLYERLNKKKMKVLVPQMVQLTLFAVLLLIFVGSSAAGCDCSGVVSFITSLVLLIEPIQVVFYTSLHFLYVFMFPMKK